LGKLKKINLIRKRDEGAIGGGGIQNMQILNINIQFDKQRGSGYCMEDDRMNKIIILTLRRG